MTNTATLGPATHLIANIPGAYMTVTYILDDPEQVKAIAADTGGALREYYYETAPNEVENWVLTVEWRSVGIHFTAQSSSTLTPSLAT